MTTLVRARAGGSMARRLRAAIGAAVLGSTLLLSGGGAGGPSAVLAAADITFCVEGTLIMNLTSAGAPGQTEDWEITSSPQGLVAFGTATDGPFSDPITVSMTYGSNGAGLVQFYARGLATGQTTLSATNQTTRAVALFTMAVDKVTSVTVEPADPAKTLDPDPASPEAGALRFFPDLDSPGGDASLARKLKAKATTELGSQSLEVRFAWGDMDDPSATSSPVDRTGDPAGGDNFGSGTAISPTSVLTDENGEAETDLFVSTKPGDNFKVVASCVPGYLNTLFVEGLGVRDGDNRSLPTPAGALSPLVTVWRHLHVETDSMGQVFGNFLSGVVASAQNDTVRINGVRQPATRLTLTSVVDVDGNPVNLGRFPRDQFALGRIQVSGGSVLTIARSARDSIWVTPPVADPTTLAGGSFNMVDDDNMNGQHDGDADFDIPEPDLSYLQESDAATSNWLAQAFIKPVHFADHDTGLPFRLQATDDPAAMYCRVIEAVCPAGQESYDHRADNGAGFVVRYLLGAYQAPTGRDGDPDGEDILGGKADESNLGAAVYVESAREARGLGIVCEAAGIAVHELTHSLGVAHDNGGGFVMAKACFDGSAQFSPSSLAQLRGAPSW